MGIPASANPLLLASAAAAGGLQVSRSLRFNSADSASLSRASYAGSGTFSCWVKRCKLGSAQTIISGVAFNASDQLNSSTAVFRDPSAYMHILVSSSGTYVNNSSVASGSSITPGVIGSGCDIYLADVYFIDGQNLTPSSFTETDATTGQLIPKAYTGSYGTNGFYLKFDDNSSNTATTLGKDYSGNGSNWTPNNLSVTAGAGNDSLVDSPTNYGTDTGVGGEVRGNYATSNPLDNGGQTLANGNLDITGIASNWRGTRGTIGMSSGKWYWEVTISFTNSGSNQSLLGIATNAASISGNYASAGAYGWEYYSNNGNKFNNGSNPSYGAAYTSGDVIGIAFDADSGSLTFYKNGSSQGTAYTGLTSGPYFPSFSLYGTSLVSFNGGQRAFAYTAPSGFKGLCTQNLPAPLVTKSNTVMDVLTWTGNSASSRALTGLGFSPDFVWIKDRSNGYNHVLFDAVRGAGGSKVLFSNRTTAEGGGAGEEGTNYGDITSFDSSGFTVAPGAVSSVWVNQSSDAYVGWAWDAGASTVSNPDGSITSQVRANPTAGFSVVTYVSNGTNNTSVGHGLNVKPALVIQKDRTSASDWLVLTQLIDGSDDYLLLNSTAAAANAAAGMTSTIFGSWDRPNGNNMVAYCFAPVVGYSNFGSYTGNGSTDGPFVYTGFRPRWVMIKYTSGSISDISNANWLIVDSARNTSNTVTQYLLANKADSEGTYTAALDILSNGFKVRLAPSDVNNSSGATYIYAAFAEAPFNYSRAR